MKGRQDLTDRLRDRILGAMHLGHLHGGDRLPSTRQVAEEMGDDARAVARAYRELEAEGLVIVRERSGVYAAPQAQVGGTLEETAQWAARMTVEAWKRGISIPRIPDFFHRCTGTRKLHCAFVEANEDVITAFTHDLREDLGLETQPVLLDTIPSARAGSRSGGGSIPNALRAADLVVTTAFHAREVGPVARAMSKPLIAATLNPDMVAAVERQLRSGTLTVICVDSRFGDRMPIQYQELVAAGNEIRVIYASDTRSIATLDRNEPVLLTRAAGERLKDIDLPLVFPHSPTISSSSVLEIAEFLIRFNLEGLTS